MDKATGAYISQGRMTPSLVGWSGLVSAVPSWTLGEIH